MSNQPLNLDGVKKIVSEVKHSNVLYKAEKMAEICGDWNMEEFDISGEMISSYDLFKQFEAARRQFPLLIALAEQVPKLVNALNAVATNECHSKVTSSSSCYDDCGCGSEYAREALKSFHKALAHFSPQ